MTRMQESMGAPGGHGCSYEVEYRASTQGMPSRGTVTWLSEEGMRVTSPGDAPVQAGEVLQLRFWVEASMRRKMGRVVFVDGGTFTVSFDLTGFVADNGALDPAPEPLEVPKARVSEIAEIEAAFPRPIPGTPFPRSPQAPRSTMPRTYGMSLSERWISRRTATHL